MGVNMPKVEKKGRKHSKAARAPAPYSKPSSEMDVDNEEAPAQQAPLPGADKATRLKSGRDGTGVSRATKNTEKSIAHKERQYKKMSSVYLEYVSRNHKGRNSRAKYELKARKEKQKK